LSKKLM